LLLWEKKQNIITYTYLSAIILNSNVMAVLLDGAEMWKFNEYDIVRLENYHASREYYISSGQQRHQNRNYTADAKHPK
jgi:hypothetical protein